MRILLIDNYDSFTYMLKDYLEQLGGECMVFRNDDPLLAGLNPISFGALVISPGPGRPSEAGMMMDVLKKFIQEIPVLGICLGHQAVGEYFGASLEHAKLPRHGKVDLLNQTGGKLFRGIEKTFKATRYHSLILTNLPEELQANCFCEGEIMGLEHKTLPIFGLQFHPESCETTEGLKMLENFLTEAKKIAQN